MEGNMRSLKTIIFGLVLVGAAFGDDAIENSGVIIMIDTLSIFLLLGTALFAYELYRMMKGGQLARSWGLLTVGIITFAFSKLIEVGATANFWQMPNWLPNVVNLIIAIVFGLGVYWQRKSLS
jgi:hypothetical protein